MQNSKLKLREIIWEITGRCENRCEYCGSKEAWDTNIDEEKIRKIADLIEEFPPEEIDISGGDPLLVDEQTHKYIVKKLKDKKVKVKILCNLKSIITATKSIDVKFKILGLYDWVEISINEQYDIELFEQCLTFFMQNEIHKKMTVITNFNISNVFLYKDIERLIKQYELPWMIQYTMYQGKNKNALYENNSAREYLFKNINDSIDDNLKIILSDNITQSQCGAGSSSIGILYNGAVVPCLSMRSWENLSTVIQGDIFYDGLKTIWENKFKKYRFCEYKCCKDICNNKFFVRKEIKKQKKLEDLDEIKKYDEDYFPNENKPFTPIYPHYPQVTLYGVGSPTTVYGVKPYIPNDMGVMAYAVKLLYSVYTNDDINFGTVTAAQYSLNIDDQKGENTNG